MTAEINIHEAKTHLSKLLHRVMAGDEIIIAKSGVPVARIVPIVPHVERRQPGTAAGKIQLTDDFFEPLAGDLLEAFEGKR